MKKRHCTVYFSVFLAVLLLSAQFTSVHAAPLTDGPICTNFIIKTIDKDERGPIFNIVQNVYVTGSTIYLATNKGLNVSTDGGNSFTNVLGEYLVTDVYASGMTIYAATQLGLSISTNGGTSFVTKTSADGLGSNQVSAVYVDGKTIYAATYTAAIFYTGGLGISTDEGKTFINKTTTNGLGDNTVSDVYAIGSTVYAATNGGLSISTDGGNSFTTKTTANGLGYNVVSGVYVLGNTIYAATSLGLSISTDGGNHFTNYTTTNGLGSNVVKKVYAVGSTVYAATAGGLSISTDGGQHFTNYLLTGVPGVNGVYVLDNRIYAATYQGLALCQDATLPVNLIDFSAKVLPVGQILLNWQTATETDNAYFQIERSIDLNQLEKLGKVPASEVSGWQGHSYSYTDEQPYSGTSYYRLWQVDISGRSTVYPWVAVVLDEQVYGVFPNPIWDNRFTLHLDEPLTARLSLYNELGQPLAVNRLSVTGRNVDLQTSSQLKAGLYLLQVEERAQVRIHRIVVK